MVKRIAVNPDLCTGCGLCEVACSLKHEKECRPDYSRIYISKIEEDGVNVPVLCMHCNDAPCVAVCPTGAMARDEKNGNVLLNADRCIGCQMCIMVCPYGAIKSRTIDNSFKILKCDLCEGDPECVKFCKTNAIQYLEEEKFSLLRPKKLAELYANKVRRHKKSKISGSQVRV